MGPAIPLWNNLLQEKGAGLIDWYTILLSGLSITTLIVQGGSFLAWKTDGRLHERSERISSRAFWVFLPYLAVTFAVTVWTQPNLVRNYRAHPFSIALLLLTLLVLIALSLTIHKGASRKIFLLSSLQMIVIFANLAFAVFPNFIIDSTGSTTVTIYNTATTLTNLQIGLIWFSVGFLLLIGYATFMYRSFWGKKSAGIQKNLY
jgi:cytochrome d ubiquinol oxidase subunit II